MSTTPVIPTATPKPASTLATPAPGSALSKDFAWIHAHVLLSIALIAGSVYAATGLTERIVANHDERAAVAQQKAEGVDTATQTALLAQLNQEQTASAARDAQQNALIQGLIQQMKQQQVATAKQVVTDVTLDAQAAAARLALQTKASPAEITASNDTVILSLPVTRVVVSDLDQFTQSQSDVTNLQGQLGAQQTLTLDAKTELSTANQLIQADKIELLATIKADNAACDVRVDKQAAKDRKRGVWATIGGFVGGVILGSRF